jgi:conjugal transfer mating pair stabilization protein TraG
MEFVIYTFGGGEALWTVFNGIALILGGSSGYMTSVMKLSMAMGGLWAGFRAILGANMGLFARDYFVPTYLILNLLLIPTAPVHIIDEVNPNFKYSKVDNVPIGIAAVASTASRISKLITNTLEEAFTSVEAGKTGAMFAARLVSMAREMRLVDPVQRQNMKDFVRQCYTLPMVWSNMLSGKKAALESENILELIAQSPHLWLGSYWRTEGGETTFLYCKEGVATAGEVLTAEVPTSLSGLAMQLFGGNAMDETTANRRLKTYFEDAWQTLSGKTASAHEVAAQEMMMNIYREAADDKREEFGLARRDPHLIALSSARAKAQQNTGFLVSAQMVSSMLPSLQSTMLAILCILFMIILPMTMLPGGLKTLGMWVKLILWVESWPVFYAVIHCVALIMASSSGAAYVSTGAGLSLLTQNGLADAAWDAYCYAEGFMTIVPVIAWAVISGSGYALANLAGTVTRSVDGLSSKIGSEITDDNLNFDNQSFHNRSIAGYQIAQQQLGSAFSFGEKYDDGRMSITYDTQGRPIIQEAQTQLKTNVAGNDNLSTSLTDTAQHSLQASHNYSHMASEQLSQGLNSLYSYAHQYSKGQGMSEGFGHTDSMGQSQDWKNTLDIAHKFAQQHQISDDKAFKAMVQAGLSTGSIGKALGLNAGISTDSSVNAQDKEIMDKAKSSGLDNQFSDSLNKAYQHSMDTKGSLTDQDQKQALDSIQGSFSNAKNWQEQSQASLQESDTFSKAASVVEGSGLSGTTNWNDQLLEYTAAKRGETVQQTAYWQSKNPDAYRAYAAEFMADKQQAFINALKSGHGMSEDQIREKFDGIYGDRIQNTIGHSDVDLVRGKASREGVGESNRQKMEQRVSGLRTETGKAFESQDSRMEKGRSKITKDYQAQEAAYDKRKEDGVAWSTGKRMVNEAEKLPGVGYFMKNSGNEANRIEDFGVDQSSYHKMKNSAVTGTSYQKEETHNAKPVSEASIAVEKLPPVNDSAPMNSPSSFSNPQETSISQSTTSGVEEPAPSPYVKTMEEGIEQSRASHKVAAQGREIRKLREFVEMSKINPSDEEPFEIGSTPKMES